MKFVGKIYSNTGVKLCEFTCKSRDVVHRDEIVIDNKISFEDSYIHEFDIVKIAQIFKTMCEMI